MVTNFIHRDIALFQSILEDKLIELYETLNKVFISCRVVLCYSTLNAKMHPFFVRERVK